MKFGPTFPATSSSTSSRYHHAHSALVSLCFLAVPRIPQILNMFPLLSFELTFSESGMLLSRISAWLASSSTSSVQFSHSVVSDSLRPHEPQHARTPCPSPTPGVHPNPCPLSRWYHPTISSSVIPFSSCPQSFPASGTFPMSQIFTSGSQNIGVSASASVLPMNTQDWSPLGWTGWISLQSRGLSNVFSNTTVQKHQFFGAQLSLYSNSHIQAWLLEKP